MTTTPIGLAVLLSGTGRTLVNLQEHITANRLDATIDIVISSRPSALGLERAKELGLRTAVVDCRTLSADVFHAGIADAIARVDLVVMAGFLSLWRIPSTHLGRVINIHPALLPQFGGKGMYGRHVHEAVLRAKAKETGCTVHFCDNEYDHGPIILQRKVAVEPSDTPDTLAAKVFDQECIAYPKAIQLFADQSVSLVDGVTRLT